MNFKSDPQALILSALADGPKHGYAIVKSIKDRSNGVFKLSEGQLYPLLQTMLQKGWLTAAWETPESGPARKVYEIQPEGTNELDKRKSDWKEFASAIQSVMLITGNQVKEG